MFKNNINYIIHATPYKKNYIVNYEYNVKINLFILTLFLTINLSCVENTITIHILPDGQTFLQIVSTGDSTDIIDDDFEHPVYDCLLYTSPSPRDLSTSRMPSSA